VHCWQSGRFFLFTHRHALFLFTERYQNGDENDANTEESANTIKTMKWSYDRLQSLLKTLEIVNVDEFASLTLVADFASLLGSYDEGNIA
jgi:hypothetical protein